MVKKRKVQRGVPEAPSSGSSGPPWVLIAGVVAAVAVGLGTLYPRGGPDVSHAGMDTAVEAADTVDAETTGFSPPFVPTQEASLAHPEGVPLPNLPLMPNMVPRPPEAVSAAYEFAARNPDVLEYVPCYCGCESAGHTGNADCFVQSRNQDGSVNSWEPHGMACIVCIDVAQEAMQLHASGGTVGDIRSAVEATYLPRAISQTPTPAPPAE